MTAARPPLGLACHARPRLFNQVVLGPSNADHLVSALVNEKIKNKSIGQDMFINKK